MRHDYQGQEEEFGSMELLEILKSKAVCIVAITLVSALVGFLLSAFAMTPKYRASVDMIVNARQNIGNELTNDNISSAKNLIPTYAVIIKNNTVMNHIISNLKLNMDAAELSEKIEISAVNSTQVMRISVEDADPALASSIVKQITAIVPGLIVETMEAGSCKVIGEVWVSDGPVSPNIKSYTVIGGLLGLILAVGVFVLKELFRNVITDEADVRRYLQLPVLGVIPEIEKRGN